MVIEFEENELLFFPLFLFLKLSPPEEEGVRRREFGEGGPLFSKVLLYCGGSNREQRTLLRVHG